MKPDYALETEETKEQLEKEKKLFNKRKIIRHAILVLLISVATIAGIFFYNNTGKTIEALDQLNFSFILICFGMLFVDLMLGCWRNHIFIRKLKPGLSQWVSFKANVSNMFMGAVTPANGGGGPAQIYIYMRNGVRFTDALAVSFLTYGSTILFMPLAGLTALLFVQDDPAVGNLIPVMLRYGFIFFSIVLSLLVIAFFKPLWIAALAKKLAIIIGKLVPKYRDKLLLWSKKLKKNITTYQQTCNLIVKKHPWLFPTSFFITILLYLNKYCMQYFILLGLGFQPELYKVILFQILIQFMIYFMPTPGSTGFAELTISALYSKIIPTGALALFTLLQRSFLLFFPAMIGAYVVLKNLHRHSKEEAEETKTEELNSLERT